MDLPPGAVELMQRYAARREGDRRAALAILPGPLRQVFAPLSDEPLRPVTLGDLAWLRSVGHPIADWFEAWLAGEAPTVPEFSKREEDALIWLWTSDEGGEVSSFKFQVSSARPEAGAPLETSNLKLETSPLLPPVIFCNHLVAPWACAVELEAPRPDDGSISLSVAVQDGSGWWLTLFGFLVRQCHLAPDAALKVPLGMAIALHVESGLASGLRPVTRGYIMQEAGQLSAVSSQPSASEPMKADAL